MESIACAMSSADRVSVPLNSMCSTKWAMPLSAALSWRDPLVSHTPMLTERTCVIGSVRMRRPLSSASRMIGEFDKVVGPLQIEVDALCRALADALQIVDTKGITSEHGI